MNQQPLGKTAWSQIAWVVGGLCFLGILFLPFDLAIARFMLQDVTPGEIRAIAYRAEVFGHGYGILAMGITIFLLDPKRRGGLPRLALNCVAAGFSANLIKLSVWRTRPRIFEGLESEGSTFLGTIFTASDWTWAQLIDSSQHSFPSAHTATAVAVAITLSKWYPAGRWWFASLALLCAFNRVDGGAHYVSDVCFGAALGYGVTQFCYHSAKVNRFLARWETPRREASVVMTPELRQVA